jgi:hypothetical protein
MSETEGTDRTAYNPFVFLESERSCSLLLSDALMVEKCPIFEELEGWAGNGYDWASVARTVLAEQLPQVQDAVSFDPEAGMFVAYGPKSAIQALAGIMAAVFHDDGRLRDLLSRSELD